MVSSKNYIIFIFFYLKMHNVKKWFIIFMILFFVYFAKLVYLCKNYIYENFSLSEVPK